jgi:hypothetical protein
VGADYLSKPGQWVKMVEFVRAAGVCGLDTEFYGMDPSKESCVKKAKIHVWSIAIRTDKMGPRGFKLCRGWCLPVEALEHPDVKALLEDKTIQKEVHNQPVDSHSLLNHGIRLRGGRNTLDYVKWQLPGLINTNGRFKLKALMNSLLGRDPICTFNQLVTYERLIQVPYTVKKKLKGCSCGVPKCRVRKASTERRNGVLVNVTHDKTTTHTEVVKYREKKEAAKYALEDIVPGHPRWDLLVAYSIEDSVAALQIAEVAEATADPAPWPYNPDNGAGPAPGRPQRKAGLAAGNPERNGERPKFSQAVVESIIKMEQTGFPRDKEFCAAGLKVAAGDEEKVLNWLYKWYVVNSGTFGPHGRRLKVKTTKSGKVSVPCGTDGIWTSGPKKLKLFDSLGFPRSPVWAKGKVKEGKSKLDWAAMRWISTNHPPSRQLIEKLLLLGRIRSGKKYLQKLHDAEEIVHPICGPAGDEDERSGAVTGRLGIKGQLEAQQLPKAGEKDLYQVRRAIIA